jgi:hypothetical protein
MWFLSGCGTDRAGRAGRSSAWRQGPGASATGSLAERRSAGTLVGEQPCESRQNRPVRRLQRRSMDLASEDAHLMAQHHDLDSEVRVLAEGEPDELGEAAERPVEEREGHCRMLAEWESRRQSPGRSPWMAFSAPTGNGRDHTRPARPPQREVGRSRHRHQRDQERDPFAVIQLMLT